MDLVPKGARRFSAEKNRGTTCDLLSREGTVYEERRTALDSLETYRKQKGKNNPLIRKKHKDRSQKLGKVGMRLLKWGGEERCGGRDGSKCPSTTNWETLRLSYMKLRREKNTL